MTIPAVVTPGSSGGFMEGIEHCVSMAMSIPQDGFMCE